MTKTGKTSREEISRIGTPASGRTPSGGPVFFGYKSRIMHNTRPGYVEKTSV